MTLTTQEGLGHYPVEVVLPVQWGDMDSFSHVNNTVYLRWFETARIAYFEKVGILDQIATNNIGPILARATIDFRLPVSFPDTAFVKATVLRLGNSSFVMGYQLKSEVYQDAVAAEGEGVIVMMDYATGQKIPLDDALRERIKDLERGR